MESSNRQDKIDGILVSEDKVDPVVAQYEEDLIVSQMSTMEGRRFVQYILQNSGFLGTGLSDSGIVVGYNLGLAEAGKRIFLLIQEYCPELYPVLINEAKGYQDYERRAADERAKQHDSTNHIDRTKT